MMPQQWLAIGIFAAVFTIATLRGVHLGVIMFGAACVVGVWLGGMPLGDVVQGFPVNIMVLLTGVTYFFGIAQANGTIDRMIEAALGRAGDNAAILLLSVFALTAGISAMGSPLAGLVMAPIGMQIARRYRIDLALMAIAVATGQSMGAFAPTSLFGIVTYGTAQEAGIDLNPFTLFAVAAAVNFTLLAAAFLIFGGLGLLGRRAALPTSAGPLAVESHDRSAPLPFARNQVATVACIIGLVVTVLGISIAGLALDLGVLCFIFGALLAFIDKTAGLAAISRIAWSTVLLVGGIVTFAGVLQHMGALDLLGASARHAGTPVVATFLVCLVAGLASAFASTTGILAALVPLAVPLAISGDLAGWAVVSALALCSSIVDVCPFSTTGATLVASVPEQERPRLLSLLTRWGLSMVVIGPAVLVGILVLPATAF